MGFPAGAVPEPTAVPARQVRSPATSPVLLSIRGLVKRYGAALALDAVDLDIPERAFVTLLGPSGCGKTTILRTIAGFEAPDAGALLLDGVPLAQTPPERRPVNTVFQSYALFPHLTVAENVAFALRMRRGVPDVATRVARALDAVHMGEFGARYPHQLSGGQQQRVAVARAIIAEPRLLLLDEPLSALDRAMRAHLQLELKALQRRLNIAFVYVTHDQDEAFALSDVVVVLDRGRVAQVSTPEEVYERPADSFVAAFIGGSTLVPGLVRSVEGGSATIEAPFGAVTAPAVAGLVPGATGVLTVRPRSIATEPPRGPSVACVGSVLQAIYQGGQSLVTAAVEGGVTLQFNADRASPPGSAVSLWLRTDQCFITRHAR